MRTEVQDILDKDWPDDLDRKWPVHGVNNMQRALILLAMHAQDISDEDLYEQAFNAASNIRHPDFPVDEPATMLRVHIPQYHNAMHDTKQKLLIFKEKHGTWHFVTNNATEFSMALLTVLNQRVEDEWFIDELYGDDLPEEGEDTSLAKRSSCSRITDWGVPIACCTFTDSRPGYFS